MQLIQSNFMLSAMNQQQDYDFQSFRLNSKYEPSMLQNTQHAVRSSHPLKKRDFTLSPSASGFEETSLQATKKRRINESTGTRLFGRSSWWRFGEMPREIKDLAKRKSQNYTSNALLQTIDPRPLPPSTIQIENSLPTQPIHRDSRELKSKDLSNPPSLDNQLHTRSFSPAAIEVAEHNDDSDSDSGSGILKYRQYQAENWSERYECLIMFRKRHGHCLVPNSYPDDVALAQWVKRQRYQYKLKQEGKRSTLSDERVLALENIGFVWDSHRAVWDERFNELLDYKSRNGNCNVPSRYTINRQLAVWVKRQRRQYKFYRTNEPSSMTEERIGRLESIGFEWDLRSRDTRES